MDGDATDVDMQIGHTRLLAYNIPVSNILHKTRGNVSRTVVAETLGGRADLYIS